MGRHGVKGHVSMTITLADHGAARVGDWPSGAGSAAVVVLDVGKQTTMAVLASEVGWRTFAAVAIEAANRAARSSGMPIGEEEGPE